MSDRSKDQRGAVTRRTFVRAGASGLALAAAPSLWFQPDVSAADSPEQIHLQFGRDTSREMVASWVTTGSVKRPRLRLGTPEDGFGRTVPAETRTYVDGASKVEVFTHHAVMEGLRPDATYTYEVLHDGAVPRGGTFTTAPRGRAPIRFTSFGDQATPNPGNGLWSVWAGFNPPQVESLKPLFHLLNGDLCYANISPDRVKTWHDFFTNNEVSARFRPWMPAAGNHENELGNGPFGFGSYQTRFFLPGNGERNPAFQGMWYTFKAGSVQVISLNNDDVCLQDGGDSYVSGYTEGAQMAWLERTLAEANEDDDVDWIVVCMHQVAMSSVHNFNGADLGIRQQWLPIFDRFGVDLIVCGHEHHYERTKAVRGVDPASPDTLRPQVVSDRLDVVDTSKGLVQMIIGGGGTSAPSDGLFYDPPRGDVIVSVGPQLPTPVGGSRPKRVPTKLTEDATWVGTRDRIHAYGFAAFDVDPGTEDGMTSIQVTLFDTAPSATGTPTVFEQFTLQRPRRERQRQPEEEAAPAVEA